MTRDKGTQIPYLLGYARDTKAELWRVQLTNNARIRRISLVDGATKWEITLVRESTENVDGMVAGEGLVFVTYGQSLRVLSLDSGEVLAKLGGW